MDDDVRGQEQKQEQKGGMAETDRRTLLRTAGLAGAAGAALAGAMHGKFSLAPVTAAQAQTATAMPKGVDRPWWPSKWGKDDEAGASNHITPAKVLDAVKWIKDGKIYKIGRVYEQGMPLFGARAFSLRIPGGPTGGPFGDNKLVYHDEFLATEIGQTGTQFDGLGHIGIQMGKDGDKSEMRFYNGFTAQEISDRIRSQEARHREAQADLHACPACRNGCAQGRDDGCRSGDLHGRYQGGAAEAEHPRERHQGRGRDHVPYGLGLAVDEKQ